MRAINLIVILKISFCLTNIYNQSVSEVAQSCPTLFDLMDCSLPVPSVHGIFQARILEWVAISFSRRQIFPSQGLNQGLEHCRQTLYHLSHQGSHHIYNINNYFLWFIVNTHSVNMICSKHHMYIILLLLISSYRKQQSTLATKETSK